MAVKVGINGFGRIGRVVFRTCLQHPEVQVTAINDPAIDVEYVCYLIKFDSTHGKFKGCVTQTDEGITVDGRLIKVFHEKLPATVPWQTVGVQYVIEASGMFTCLEKASNYESEKTTRCDIIRSISIPATARQLLSMHKRGHLASDSVQRVIITAPSVDVPMIILGVNDNKLNAKQKVLSCASSTLYCLAPIIKVLEDKYGVSEGFITSIHAMTLSLKPLDGLCLRGKHWRDHRSIHQNIIPATTGACKALGKIIPRVKDKMTGLAFRVPIVNVSVLDISIRLDTNTTLQEIISNVENVRESDMENIIKVSSDQAVSSDFLGDSHSCILDAASSLQLKPNFFKIVCWYENEYSYACRILDSIFFSEKQFRQQVELLSGITFIRPRTSNTHERNRKQISLKCSCNSEVSTKILCSTSQDTGFKSKPTSRPIILRKPISSHTSHTVSSCNRETNKKNDILKIWNDSHKMKNTASRQHRSSLFYNLNVTETETGGNADCIKAQERLEIVKKEFSKMVSITEDLLRKSGSNKFKFSSLATTSKEDVGSGSNMNVDASSLDQYKWDYVDKDNTATSNHILDVCGDCKNSIGVTNIVVRKNSNSEIKVSNKTFERKEMLPQHVLLNTKSVKKNEDITIINSSLDSFISKNSNETTVIPNAAPENNAEISNSSFDFKEQVAKTINTLIDGLSQNIQEHRDSCNDDENIPLPDISNDEQSKELVADEVIVNIIGSGEKQTSEKKTCDTQTSDFKKSKNNNIDIVDEAPERQDLKDFVKYMQSENYNMRVIDEELRKRNIVLVNSQKYDTNSELFRSVGSERLTVERDDHYIDMNIKNRILESLNRLAPESMVMPQDTSGCESPDNTTISNAGSKYYKQDIYDKLDSASGTDSNDSFEIKERKSQVIHITDLTNSLEDLARLDKICRIIEISDELSDKLFSALDNYDGMQLLHKKKWSFKDFCEKIKLDDFCNKVFGKAV